MAVSGLDYCVVFSAFQLRLDYNGLAPLFGLDGFSNIRMNVLAFQSNLHRLQVCDKVMWLKKPNAISCY